MRKLLHFHNTLDYNVWSCCNKALEMLYFVYKCHIPSQYSSFNGLLAQTNINLIIKGSYKPIFKMGISSLREKEQEPSLQIAGDILVE